MLADNARCSDSVPAICITVEINDEGSLSSLQESETEGCRKPLKPRLAFGSRAIDMISCWGCWTKLNSIILLSDWELGTPQSFIAPLESQR